MRRTPTRRGRCVARAHRACAQIALFCAVLPRFSFAATMKSWDDRRMALTVKGSRLITVDGTVYRWRMRRKPSYSQECLGGPLTFAVELAGVRGSVLSTTILDAGRPDSLVLAAMPSLIVRSTLVASVIQAALDRGWQPAAPGAQFRLSLARDDLPAKARTEILPTIPG